MYSLELRKTMFIVEKYHKYLIDETSICEVCSFKPRFIDCFPPAYHNSFSVGLKRCLSCYKYHFDGYRISSWQRKWFSLHSSYENGLLLALYLFYNIEEGLGLVFVVTMTGAINRCGWLICLIPTTWTGKVFMFAFTQNFSPFMFLLFISIKENERMSKQHVMNEIPSISTDLFKITSSIVLDFKVIRHISIWFIPINKYDVSNTFLYCHR